MFIYQISPHQLMIEFINGIKDYFNQIIVSIVILLAGFGLGILVKKILFKLFKEIELNNIMSKVGVMTDLEKWVSSILSYVVYLLTIVLFLDQLGIESIVLYLISGAILMLVILTALVGLKDIIPNFIAWLVLQKRGKIKPGTRVEIREIAGVVEKVGFLETEIRTDNDDILYVPNSLFLKSKLKVKRNNRS